MKNIRVVRRFNQVQGWERFEENFEADLQFQSGQRRANTKMDAAAKGRMRLSLAVRLKNVRLIVDTRVPVRSA